MDCLGAETGAGAVEVRAASRCCLWCGVALVYALKLLGFVSCGEWVAADFPGKIAALFFGREPCLRCKARQLLSG